MTVVRGDLDYARLGGIMPYRVPVFRPLLGVNEEIDITIPTILYITFAPEYDQDVHQMGVYVKVWDIPWRWYCQDCYASGGDRRDVFATDWARREDLEGKGSRESGGFSEATYDQQQQMNKHGRQHSIMWAWARGLK